MGAPATKQDLKELEKRLGQHFAGKSDLKSLDTKLDSQVQRLDDKIDHAIDVLEQKIERSERNLRADMQVMRSELISHFDRRLNEVMRTIANALAMVTK